MALLSFISTTFPDSPAPSFQQIAIISAFLVVVALAARSSATVFFGLKQPKAPSSLADFARFFYASFLKPHNGDGEITGQQAALESFYKAQVVSPLANFRHFWTSLRATSFVTLLFRHSASPTIMETIKSSGAS